MKQLGINPEMDELARNNGLGHWSCVSPLNSLFWLRSDGLSIKLLDDSSPIIENLDWYDDNETKGEDWQQPETEEDFLNRKLPCDIKIGGGVNRAGTSIKTLLLRLNNVIASQDIVADKDKRRKAKELLLDLIATPNDGELSGDWQQPTPEQPIRNNALSAIQDMLSTGTGVTNHQFFDAEMYSEIVKDITDPVGDLQYQCATKKMNDLISSKQPALVQNPFQYPCDGALYFTRESHEQVFLTGYLNHHEKQVVGKLPTDKAGKFTFFNATDGCVSIGNSANDLIMMVWE